MPLVGADVDGRADGPGDAVPVEQRHAAGHAGGTAERARIDRRRAAPEMVIPAHVAGVVHEEGVELRTRERQGARLRATDEGDVGRVVVDVVAAHRGVFINAPTGRIHDDVVAHGRVIIRRQAALGGYQNAIDAAVGRHVVGDDFTGSAVVQVNAGGGSAGHDIVHDDAIRPAEVDAVNEIGAAQGADVVDHVADDLNARPVVVATVPDNARGAG